MARNRNNNTADFLKTFQTTYGLARGAMKDYDMAGIAKATPEESQGFTAEDGQQLEAIANAKKEDGTPYYSVTADDKGGYQVGSNFEIQNADVVTPAPAALGQRGVANLSIGAMQTPAPFTIAQRGVTDFLGKRQSGSMTEAQVLGARQNAMAGVMEKYGDATGAMQYRQQAQQGVRQVAQDARQVVIDQQAATRFAREEQAQPGIEERDSLLLEQARRANEQGKQTQQESNAKRALGGFYAAGDMDGLGKFMTTNYNDGMNYQIVKNEDGTLTGIQSDQNTKQEAGRVTFKSKEDMFYQLVNRMDPAKLIDRTRDDEKAAIARGDVDRRFKNEEDAAARLATYQTGTLGLSQAAGGRAKAEFDSQASVRQLAATVGTLQLGLANTDDPVQQQAIQAKLAAIQNGLGGDKNAPSEVKLASALVKAGLAPDMRSALGMALNRKSDSPDERHQDYVATGLKNMNSAAQAVKAADEVMTQMGFAKKNGRWTQGQGGGASSAPAGPVKGTTLNGFEFQGGDPNDKKNWRSVAVGKVR